MKYEIPFGAGSLWADLPESMVAYCAYPATPDIPADVHELIESALDNPYGTDLLENMIEPNSRIMILIDDITRPTPKKLLLEHVIARLKKAGISDWNISVCVAPGTHRKMTDAEICEYVGEDIPSRFTFLNLNYKDTENLLYLGDTPSGIPIDVHKQVMETDFLIGIGNIVPHVSAGWGGGAKIVQPGVCGERTTKGTHLVAAVDQNVMETCGNADNKCRHEMELIAARVGLKFIVNTVMDEHKNLLGVFCGDFIKAHRAGIELAKRVLCPPIPCKADIVIASANPCEIDFWQGDKPFVFAQYGLKDNGTLIFVMDGREGLTGNAADHEPTLRKYCPLGEERVREDVKKNLISDVIAIDLPIHLDQVRKRGVNTLLVTNGLTPADSAALKFELCTDLEEALKKAFQRQGADAIIGIIPYCGETMVRVEEQEDSIC